MPYTMDRFRKDVKAAMGTVTVSEPPGKTAIMGDAVATAKQMKKYLLSVNPNAKAYADLADIFLSEGKAEGVRGDVAFAQSCLETGNFTFKGDVKPEQNNFAGLGATGGSVRGNAFATPQLGIRAQIQHLKAYASTEGLRQDCVDGRFKYVSRGCAPYVEWLGQKENPDGRGWAAGAGYGEKIRTILTKIVGTAADTPKPNQGRKQRKYGTVSERRGRIPSRRKGHIMCLNMPRSALTKIPLQRV